MSVGPDAASPTIMFLDGVLGHARGGLGHCGSRTGAPSPSHHSSPSVGFRRTVGRCVATVNI